METKTQEGIGFFQKYLTVWVAVRNLLDRLYEALKKHSLTNKSLFFLFQGAAPDKWMIEAGEYSIRMFATLYGIDYKGMATTNAQAKELSHNL